MVASVAIGIISLGIRYSFGVFFKSLEGEFGLNRASTSGIFSTYMLLAAGVSILGGWIMDKYGPKRVAMAMSLFTGLSLIASSRVGAPWQLYITYSVLLSIGNGALFTIINSTASRWFVEKRGFVVGITSSAGAIGEVVMAPLSALLLAHFDWRMSFIILGAMALMIMIPASRMLKSDPGEIGLLPDGASIEACANNSLSVINNSKTDGLSLSEAWKTQGFWFLIIIWLFLSLSVHMILTHVVPHAIDLGISSIDASFIISLVGIGAILGRVINGKLSDSIGRKIPAISSASIQVATLFSLIFIQKLWMFYVVALFFGFGWGGLGAQVTLLVGDIFGLRSIGAIMGAVTAGWNFGAAVGPTVGGLLFDATRSYSSAFAVAALGMLISTTFCVLISTRAKVRTRLP